MTDVIPVRLPELGSALLFLPQLPPGTGRAGSCWRKAGKAALCRDRVSWDPRGSQQQQLELGSIAVVFSPCSLQCLERVPGVWSPAAHA